MIRFLTFLPCLKLQEKTYSTMSIVLVRVLLLWRDTMTKASLIKKQHLIGAGFQVQRFSPLSSRWEHGSIQAGMVQEELRVLCLHPKAASGRLTSRQLGWGSYTHTHSDTPIPTRSHLFQQGHTFRWCHSLVQGYTNHYTWALHKSSCSSQSIIARAFKMAISLLHWTNHGRNIPKLLYCKGKKLRITGG